MNSLALEIEKQLPTLDPQAAHHFEQAVKAMLLMAKRRELPAQAEEARTATPYRTQPQPLSLNLGLSSHKWTELLDAAEGPEWK